MSVELISIHIPKTAGASFRVLLSQIYGERNIYFDSSVLPDDPGSQMYRPIGAVIWRAKTYLKNMTMRRNIKVIHGHFPASKYSGYFESAKRITWLRDPINRLMSHYFFWINRKKPTNNSLRNYVVKNNVSFIEFARMPIMQNIYSGIFLKGISLDDMSFVGIFEHYKEDMESLRAMMGWPQISLPQVNVNPKEGYREYCEKILSDKAMMDELRSLNKKDIDLYNRALEIRAKRS